MLLLIGWLAFWLYHGTPALETWNVWSITLTMAVLAWILD